ncbi:MAG TPA: hypothetical protein PLS87_11240 [Ferruginibacter sp.]|nr:hypothetical protein [Ferruginibacter sp.]HRO97642.1 hypothetical protein [Ferruginibacter sp.]
MAREVRTSKAKLTIELAPSLRERFHRQSKKLNTSTAQRIRDFMQRAVKGKTFQ